MMVGPCALSEDI